MAGALRIVRLEQPDESDFSSRGRFDLYRFANREIGEA
jgi:hypothetical protein